MPPWIKCWHYRRIKHIWMHVFTENRPFPLKANHYKGLKYKSLVNICRPKTITKVSSTTATHLCSDATSITLVMSVEKKSQDLRLSSEIHASCGRTLQKKHLRFVAVVLDFKNTQRPLVSLKKKRFQQIQELSTVTSMSFFSFIILYNILVQGDASSKQES